MGFYGKQYEENKTYTVLCKTIEEVSDGYSALGIRRERIEARVKDKIKRKLGTETGNWYEIRGVVSDIDDDSFVLSVQSEDNIEEIGEKVNDWIYEYAVDPASNSGGQSVNYQSSGRVSSPRSQSGALSLLSQSSKLSQSAHSSVQNASVDRVRAVRSPESASMSGFAAGGSKDVGSFRENIAEGQLPQPESVTSEGIFYDYEFDTPERNKDSMFYPTYSEAVTENPITGDTERFLAVGLGSGLESFNRPALDLMIVADISGSMSQDLQSYYYDSNQIKAQIDTDSKIEFVRQILKDIVDQLQPEDRVGVSLFNGSSYIAKPLREVSETDFEELKNSVDETVSAGGGTSLSRGYESGVEEIKEYGSADRQQRVMLLTDAMPNEGLNEESELTDMFKNAAHNDIYTTVVGVGVDANQELVRTISQIRGANSYFSDELNEFQERANEEFPYIVTPLVFDLKLTVEGDGFTIDSVYGNPNNSVQDDGTVMNTKTLFPSTGKEGTRGGIILLKISDATSQTEIQLSTSWRDLDGNKGGDVTRITLTDQDPEYFDSTAVEKSILLARYVDVLSEWLTNVAKNNSKSAWERQSNPISASEEDRTKLSRIRDYVQSGIPEVGDDSLEKEVEQLDTILDNTQGGDTETR